MSRPTSARRIFLLQLVTTFAIALLLSSGCSPKDSSQQNNQTEIHYKQAATFSRVEQFNAAISNAEKALQRTPNHKKTLELLTQIYLKLGLFEDAVNLLDNNAAAEDKNIDLALLHIKALSHAGKPSLAKKNLETNPTLWSDHPIQRKWADALILETQGLYDEAQSQYFSIIREEDYAPAKLGYLRTAIVTMNCDALDDYFSTPLGDGTQQKIKVLESQCLLLAGDFEMAAQNLTDVLAESKSGDRLTLERSALLLNISDALKKINRIPEAMIYTELVEQESAQTQNDTKILGLVTDLIEQGQRDQAAIIFEGIQRFESKQDKIEALVAQYYYRKGQVARAALWLARSKV